MLEETKEGEDLGQVEGTPEEIEGKGKEWLEKVENLLAFVASAEIRLALQNVEFSEGLEMDEKYFKVRLRIGIIHISPFYVIF